MMNKIFNWTIGSFFRTLGRILVYLALGLLISKIITANDIKLPSLFNVLNVYADIDIGLGNNNNFNTMTDITIYNNSGGQLSAVSGAFGSTIGTIYTTLSPINFNANGYGAVVGFNINGGLLANHIYALTLYVGHGDTSDSSYFKISNYYQNTGVMIGNSASDIRDNWNAGAFYVTNVLYSNNINTNEKINYYMSTSSMWSYRTSAITYIFVSNYNSQYLGIPFTNSISENKMVYVYGYSIEELGQYDLVTNSSLNSAINNSGLATASSVNQVQSSVNQVQQEIQGTQDAIDEQTQQQQENHEETMNTITDDTAPDNLNALSNSAGWLPAGPVDSILNLPLNFLNSLFNNLSKSCTPVQLPLPFVNQNLQLPCVNSLYSQINGVPNWINGTVGLIASAFILFSYLIRLYKYIDDTLTFRENNYIDNWSGV